ncbi:nitroreductase family deazaflavin-dependent oxidoreductase [Rhodococcus yananensis]|nr:nitroreductase family deazaflavin-dependent oxidoreductase [Rhodococcus yananensis]
MNPIRSVAVRLGAKPWLPRYTKLIVGSDRLLQRVSRGHITLLTVAGLPGLKLTVRGRRSGLTRTTPLLCVPRDDGWLVAGSNWGAPETPSWVHNLRAAEYATVGYRGRSVRVSVRIAEGPERDVLWAALVATWPNYELYAHRTTRRIPVFVLTPVR